MSRVDQWVDKYGWQIISLIVAGTVAVTTAKAQLNGKADKTDVERLEVKVDAIHRMLCRDPRNSKDSACP